MNRFIVWFLALVWVLSSTTSQAAISVPGAKASLIKSFSVREQLFSTKMTFSFVDLPSYKSHLQKKEDLFTIDFTHTTKSDLDSQGVIKQISALSFVKSVVAADMASDIPAVRLAIALDLSKFSILVRPYEDLKQVVVEIFSRERLSKFAGGAHTSVVEALNESQPQPRELVLAFVG